MPSNAFAGPLAAARRAPRAGFTLIELMVVVGIAALLLTISATAFFGASRTENLTRSRNQLRDVLLMARQQACITQKPHVVVCYNVDSEIEVGGSTQKVEQGRFALFRYVGRVWPQGDKLAAPFGLQRDLLSTLSVRERLTHAGDGPVHVLHAHGIVQIRLFRLQIPLRSLPRVDSARGEQLRQPRRNPRRQQRLRRVALYFLNEP